VLGKYRRTSLSCTSSESSFTSRFHMRRKAIVEYISVHLQRRSLPLSRCEQA
jgi:hypothetical protein